MDAAPGRGAADGGAGRRAQRWTKVPADDVRRDDTTQGAAKAADGGAMAAAGDGTARAAQGEKEGEGVTAVAGFAVHVFVLELMHGLRYLPLSVKPVLCHFVIYAPVLQRVPRGQRGRYRWRHQLKGIERQQLENHNTKRTTLSIIV